MVRPQRTMKKKIPETPSGIESATFRLVALCFNQLHQWMPHIVLKEKVNFVLEQATEDLDSFFNFSVRWEWLVKANIRPLYLRERPRTHL
jgi:hypothetical protein